MGFTGSLILARTPDSLLDMDLLAPHEAELVGRHDDHWQLAAVHGDFPDVPGWARRTGRGYGRARADRGRR
ncbi:hypothetical protein [Amycolatopsis sp. cmx-11-51]|uniref:hypothetical protein n=1 Tax=Amycolatopsis sp. cmx-11-51 TaxID=2785797 RepID=UPI0039E39AA1